MPQSQGARLPAPRLHPPHAAKTMQSRMMFSEQTLRSVRLLRGNFLKKDSQIGACLRGDIMMFAPLGTNRFGGD